MPKDKPKLRLVGENGNAFAILARARKALKRAGRSSDVEAFTKEATSGSYDHLLVTCMEWFDVDPDEDE